MCEFDKAEGGMEPEARNIGSYIDIFLSHTSGMSVLHYRVGVGNSTFATQSEKEHSSMVG